VIMVSDNMTRNPFLEPDTSDVPDGAIQMEFS